MEFNDYKIAEEKFKEATEKEVDKIMEIIIEKYEGMTVAQAKENFHDLINKTNFPYGLECELNRKFESYIKNLRISKGNLCNEKEDNQKCVIKGNLIAGDKNIT